VVTPTFYNTVVTTVEVRPHRDAEWLRIADFSQYYISEENRVDNLLTERLPSLHTNDMPTVSFISALVPTESSTLDEIVAKNMTSGLLSSPFRDVWLDTHPSKDGFTCCEDQDLQNTQTKVYYKGAFVLLTENDATKLDVVKTSLIGLTEKSQDTGLWLSMRKGQVVTFKKKEGKGNSNPNPNPYPKEGKKGKKGKKGKMKTEGKKGKKGKKKKNGKKEENQEDK